MFDAVLKENKGKLPDATAAALEKYLTKNGTWESVSFLIFFGQKFSSDFFLINLHFSRL